MKNTALFVLLGVCFGANAWGQAACPSQQAGCSPGQYVDTTGNQPQCRACTGNTISGGCKQSCDRCGAGTVTNAAHTSCAAYPPGTYKDNSNPVPFGGGCQPTEMDGGTLRASCTNFFGVKEDTALPDAEKCATDRHDIENINGHLRCVISSQRAQGRSSYTADIISILSDVKVNTDCLGKNCPPNQETIVSRIDQPRVDIPTDEYKSITFKPGDNIAITAGGCVQTGGAGLAWKSYPHPTGVGADLYFSGTVAIDGVTSNAAPQRLAGLINKTLAIPIPTNTALNSDLFLQLGYQDSNYSDNGYYAHDNGTNNQCLNVGPAWVEVTVVRQLRYVPNTAVWSPYSRPFDLVWDVNGEDYNGLPVNPAWGWQVDHPMTVPDFSSQCGNAFNGGNLVDPEELAKDCTSQPTIVDISGSPLLGYSELSFTGVSGVLPSVGQGYCNGVINGHLNWMVATYTGVIDYADWSGDPQVTDAYLDDGDYNLSLQTWGLGAPGLTTNENAINLEFKDTETIYRAVGPWFQKWPSSNVPQMFDPYGDGRGLPGVVTGEMGIDGVHKGYSELHPVFALALNTSATSNNVGPIETWAYFLRRVGNGGGCSSLNYTWPSQIGGGTVYYIQLPWRGTDPKVVEGTASAWAWQDEGATVSIVTSAEPGWTLIKVQFPDSAGDYGVDGQFTLQYGTAHSDQAHEVKRRTVAQKEKEKEDEFDLKTIAARIADPAAKAKFTADVQTALKSLSIRPPVKRLPITIDTKMKVEPRTPGAASRGEGTRAQTSKDPVKKNQNDALKKLIDTYRPQIQAAPPPANK